jgi:hypothetical protein
MMRHNVQFNAPSSPPRSSSLTSTLEESQSHFLTSVPEPDVACLFTVPYPARSQGVHYFLQCPRFT